MAAKIIKRFRIERYEEYTLSFEKRDSHGDYSFPCDKNGHVDIDSLNQASRKNYEGCVSGAIDVWEGEVTVYSSHRRYDSIGECECCGAHIVLSSFTNTCECGADYNVRGNRLTNRAVWGEETGEHWSECL